VKKRKEQSEKLREMTQGTGQLVARISCAGGMHGKSLIARFRFLYLAYREPQEVKMEILVTLNPSITFAENPATVDPGKPRQFLERARPWAQYPMKE
jgi:hypothetical protein